jgi:hypothetical protein
MIFLISYDRKSGEATWLGEYPDSEMARAQQERLAAELDARKLGTYPEIVLLGAERRSDLKRTHAKYFGAAALKESVSELSSPRTSDKRAS